MTRVTPRYGAQTDFIDGLRGPRVGSESRAARGPDGRELISVETAGFPLGPSLLHRHPGTYPARARGRTEEPAPGRDNLETRAPTAVVELEPRGRRDEGPRRIARPRRTQGRPRPRTPLGVTVFRVRDLCQKEERGRRGRPGGGGRPLAGETCRAPQGVRGGTPTRGLSDYVLCRGCGSEVGDEGTFECTSVMVWFPWFFCCCPFPLPFSFRKPKSVRTRMGILTVSSQSVSQKMCRRWKRRIGPSTSRGTSVFVRDFKTWTLVSFRKMFDT